jgi:hypothetical protein
MLVGKRKEGNSYKNKKIVIKNLPNIIMGRARPFHSTLK